MDVKKKCVICEVEFTVPHWREATAQTCSRACRGRLVANRYEEARAKMLCKACGKEYSVPQSHKHRRIYCSRACAARHTSNLQTGVKGTASRAWKGGRTQHSGGYLYVRIAEHPFAGKHGYVFQHRVVMEEWMTQVAPDHPFLTEIDGRKYLRPEIEVHHINEVKSDFRRSNLLACTSGAHRAIHDGRAPMHGEVWPEIDGLTPFEPYHVVRKCGVCGAEFTVKRSAVKRGAGKFCSRACYDRRPRPAFSVTFK